MRKRLPQRLLLSTCVLLVGLPIVAQRAEDLLEALRSPDWQRRKWAREYVLTQRQVVVEGMLGLIQDPELRQDRPGAVAECMRFLGDLRAPEAVPVLVDLVSFDPWRAEAERGVLARSMFEMGSSGKPAAWALIQIGSPAIQPTLAKLAETEAGVERRACCWVLERILGIELALAAVEIETSKHEDRPRRANLEAALDHLREREQVLEQLQKEK